MSKRNEIEVAYQLIYTTNDGYMRTLWFNATSVAQAVQLIKAMRDKMNIGACTLIKGQYKVSTEVVVTQLITSVPKAA